MSLFFTSPAPHIEILVRTFNQSERQVFAFNRPRIEFPTIEWYVCKMLSELRSGGCLSPSASVGGRGTETLPRWGACAEDASCQRTLRWASTSVAEAPDIERIAAPLERGRIREMAGTMILIFQAVPLPSFETGLLSERRNRFDKRKRSTRKEKLTPVKARVAENTQKTTLELLRRISGCLETQEMTTIPPGIPSRHRRRFGTRQTLRFPEDEIDQGVEGGGEFVWRGVGQELRLIADRMVAARGVEYQGRADYYATSDGKSDSSNIIYSLLMVAIFKYICNLFTKFN